MRWHEVTGETLAAGRARRGAGGGGRDPDRAHGPRAGLRSRPAWRRSAFSSRTCVPSRRARARLPREPVPVVARDRRDPPRQAARPPSDRFRVLIVLPEQAEHRHRRHARRCSPSSSKPTTGRTGFLACTLYAHDGPFCRPHLRAREGRHRRRPLADDRLGQPQRALALQRHRGERRHARRRRSRARPGCGSGRSTWSSRSSEVQGDPTRIIDDAVEADRRGAARSAESRRTPDAPPRPATPRIAKVRAAARASAGAARRRLTRSVVASRACSVHDSLRATRRNERQRPTSRESHPERGGACSSPAPGVGYAPEPRRVSWRRSAAGASVAAAASTAPPAPPISGSGWSGGEA